jgi:ATP-dependent DNA helicase PIF1
MTGEIHRFEAQDEAKVPNNPHMKSLQNNCPAPTVLELKIGAQVMLLRNLDFEQELVNGARGVVVGFQTNKSMEKCVLVKFSNGTTQLIAPDEWQVEVGREVQATRRQIPLALAWALSIHKSQGMTIQRLKLALDHVFECGQAYVALSRATSLQGLQLTSFNPALVKAHHKVLKFYATLKTL